MQDFIIKFGNLTPKYVRTCLLDFDVQIPIACIFWKRKHDIHLEKRNWLYIGCKMYKRRKITSVALEDIA